MEMQAANVYRPLWRTWGILLGLTVIMVFVDVMSLPRLFLLFVLLAAMMTKAFLIATEFMELKHEKLVVGFTIAFSLLFLGAILYALIVPDGIAVLHGGR